MKLASLAVIAVLICAFSLSTASVVLAEDRTITSAVFITMREEPKEILSENEDLKNCFESQRKQDLESQLEISTEKIVQAKNETEQYTICDKL